MPQVDPRPLSELTTLRTGGTPATMIDARSDAELVDALTSAWDAYEPWLVLGGGSNLFVADEPFEGTVVRVLTEGIERLPATRPGFARLKVAAGHSWDALVAFCVEEGLAGVAAMSGIPGTVGAAPVQNIGAYGQEIVQSLVEVELLDERGHTPVTVPAGELGLGFRTSVLKHHHGSVPVRSAVIVSVTLELREVGTGRLPVHGDQLRRALQLAPDAEASLADIRTRVLETRASKGMLLDDSDPDTYSAGSFFQNAIVTASFARTLPDACPRWPVTPDVDPMTVIPLSRFDGQVPRPHLTESDVKVSAAWLIEQTGLRKGFALPRSRASLSTKHALALTNRGSATAAELAELARFVQGRVQAEFGLILQPEPVLIGIEL